MAFNIPKSDLAQSLEAQSRLNAYRTHENAGVLIMMPELALPDS